MLVDYRLAKFYNLAKLCIKVGVLLSIEGWARTGATLIILNITLAFLDILAFKKHDYFILIICSIAFICSLFAAFYYLRKAFKAPDNKVIDTKNSKLLGIINSVMAIMWFYNGFTAETSQSQFLYIIIAIFSSIIVIEELLRYFKTSK